MKYTKRQQLFVLYYSDPNSETYGNADKSAVKAKYTPTMGCKLLKREYIKEAIKVKSQEIAIKSDWDREYKAKIAKQNFLESKTQKDKLAWWNEMCKLEGDYVIKQEITTEDKNNRENETIRKEINRLININ